MKSAVVALSALFAFAVPAILQAAPVKAQAAEATAETVQNPFQGSPAGDEPAAKAPSKAKKARAVKSEPALSDADAKKRCGTDAVVWANKKSKVFHYAGSSHYGRTKNGVYMCEKESAGAGMRPAKNEKRS